MGQGGARALIQVIERPTAPVSWPDHGVMSHDPQAGWGHPGRTTDFP